MSSTWLITNLLAAFLLPPLNALLPVGLGWALWRRRPRLARGLVGAGALLLFLMSMPVVGDALLRTLEGEPVSAEALLQTQAIVVLGGGRYRDAPEYGGGDTVGDGTLMRLRYAARLQRETGLPILVSGGKPDGGDLSEAATMRDVLAGDFAVPVRWVEGASDDTRQNARLSAEQLKRDGVSRVLLVTHAWHMPRAMRSFAAAGVAVTPAPTFLHREPLTPLDFLPQPEGMLSTRHAMHEWIGLAWYALRG
jgi:uncharacterized SAM-binding protein YcdF (DUF218 family)